MALCGGILLEEALDLSFDRLLMVMMMTNKHSTFNVKVKHLIIFSDVSNYVTLLAEELLKSQLFLLMFHRIKFLSFIQESRNPESSWIT